MTAPGSRLARIGWIWRRLRVMGAAEVGWRVRQALAARLEARGIGLVRPVDPHGQCGRAWNNQLPMNVDAAPYRAAAERILAGRFDVFALRDAALGFPPRWNVDPKTGIDASLNFGKRIDYRDEGVCGDIKYLWEPNRHLEIVSLAQAWHLTRDDRYAEGCRQLLDSWFDQCPYPMGPNWTSSLEHGIRLVNWAVAWHLLGGEQATVFAAPDGAAFRRRWLASVRQHCHFIAGWLSRYSSANNHLLGETMGLFVGATTWPLWPESAGWRSTGLGVFEREALLQTTADGVNREQAIWYQHAVMEMMLIVGLFGQANEMAPGAQFWRRLEAMMSYVAALSDRSGHLPMLGDSDDSTIVRWDPQHAGNPYASLLSSGAALFARPDWLNRSAGCDARNRWLLGERLAANLDVRANTELKPRTRVFEEGGRYLLGARFGEPDEVLASFDAGPLGYPQIAAHGHADALSLTLSAGGVELLIDPGTYAYHTDRKWRDYFRSTFAHNTVEIDGLDQSVSGGNFLWLRKARARCLSHDLLGPLQRVEAEHDGYARLSPPIGHCRQVTYDPVQRQFMVEDRLSGVGEHRGRLCWHLAETCGPVVQDDGIVRVDAPGVRMTIRVRSSSATGAGASAATVLSNPPVVEVLTGLAPVVLHGRDDPPAGWVSRRFDIKQATHTLVWDFVVRDQRTVTTIIDLTFVADNVPRDL